ncbi:ubiquitin carboxyl-terminal hydrolase 31 [Lingula anatina]|uniref:ubiquitinyl hydrolase 1 n=1 Tax=Lingula anatina TaxID=7574 RepID=A0A1S3JX10_LINAN|nr:ubiquitin carboxyl-terminal hydrolase 31 [Lingula anatina]|eukprot:XP_013414847.1 ubiquitin carboxyl-terminal hydrolase 31 [Lingula anatina]
MSTKVPSRQRAASDGDVLEDDEDEGGFAGAPLQEGHPQVSQSVSGVGKTQSLDRQNSVEVHSYVQNKRKGFKPSKSFGNFVKFMKRMLPVYAKKKNTSSATSDIVTGAGGRRSSDTVDSTLHPSRPNGHSPYINQKNGFTPGVSGLKNHGNTCFMNAVLQCLSNTDILAEYFVTDQYKEDIGRHNKYSSKRFGTKGEVTDQLAVLLKSIWTCQYTPEVSSEFKSVIGKYGTQYRGYAQHDAQEFLMWLLDKLHEDLNIAPKKKYKQLKSSHYKTEEQAAEAALASHNRCNNSFVYELFQALYRSSLRCPRCSQQSNTFDPFLCVSLPIPQKTTRPVYVTIVYLDARPKQVRIGLTMEVGSTVQDLRETLSTETGIEPQQIVLTEIYFDGFHRTFNDDQPLSDIHESVNLYAIECPSAPVDKSRQAQLTDPTSYGSPCEQTGSCVYREEQLCQLGVSPSRFGSPQVLMVDRESTFEELQEEILTLLADSIKEGVQIQKDSPLFRLRVVDGIAGKCYLPHDVDHPLYMPTVDRALTHHLPSAGPQHLKLVAEWEPETKASLITSSPGDSIQEHASVQQAKQAQNKTVVANLEQCFSLYTKEEKLGAEDAWNCPTCKKLQQGTIKKLSLWSLPDILVIHLKRFKQVGMKRVKMTTLVEFPVTGLDMSTHVVRKTTNQSQWSPWRRHRKHCPCPEDYVYDLYAVCNHYGNMAGGHYTAFCKNPADDLWYSFDDTHVSQIREDQTVTSAAYLLFYQRRTFSNHHSCGSSSSSSGGEHWVYRMQPFQFKPRSASQSEENLLDNDNAGLTSEERRNIAAYATMRRPKSKSGTVSPLDLSAPLAQQDGMTPPSSRSQSPAKSPKEHRTSDSSSQKRSPTKSQKSLSLEPQSPSRVKGTAAATNSVGSKSSNLNKNFSSASSQQQPYVVVNGHSEEEVGQKQAALPGRQPLPEKQTTFSSFKARPPINQNNSGPKQEPPQDLVKNAGSSQARPLQNGIQHMGSRNHSTQFRSPQLPRSKSSAMSGGVYTDRNGPVDATLRRFKSTGDSLDASSDSREGDQLQKGNQRPKKVNYALFHESCV